MTPNELEIHHQQFKPGDVVTFGPRRTTAGIQQVGLILMKASDSDLAKVRWGSATSGGTWLDCAFLKMASPLIALAYQA